MRIEFATKKMQKACGSDKAMRKEWGDQLARKLRQRLSEFGSFDSLADASLLPTMRCHELSGNRSGQFAVDLIHPRRLTFRPGHDPLPTKTDGGLDWSKVTVIVMVEVIDYH